MNNNNEFLKQCYEKIKEINRMFATTGVDKFEAEELVGKIKGLNMAIVIHKQLYGEE